MNQISVYFVFIMVLSVSLLKAQESQPFSYQPYFTEAYLQYPNISDGVLEAVAFTRTHLNHLVPDNESQSCIGLPSSYGVMGLIEDGYGYFNNNLFYISEHSRYSVDEIKNSPRLNILAYAEAYNNLLVESNINSKSIESQIPVLIQLSELPNPTMGTNELMHDNFAIQTQLYGILDFMKKEKNQNQYHFKQFNIDFLEVFGQQNLSILSSSHILISDSEIQNREGGTFDFNKILSADYPPAIWDPAASCNYSSRSGTPISAVTIHTIQGSYAGAISWFKNCTASVSAHYVIRSSDGQITQMVSEFDKAWHVGSQNPYTIGLEHEGFIADPSWYTDAMYISSANLVRDIANSGYGINSLRTYNGPSCTGGSSSCQLGGCIKVKGHQHFPSQSHTDPGINWDWVKYYNLINSATSISEETTASGTLCDSGGASNDYANDERILTRIIPTSASTITLDFTSFDLEEDWDYLTIYSGPTVQDPVFGNYTGTTSPGNFTINSSAVLIEFRSDCATVKSGYCLDWTSTLADMVKPTVVIGAIPDPVENDFTVLFTDEDNVSGSGVGSKFFLVSDFDGNEWRSNDDLGFFYDDFSNNLNADWTIQSGLWSVVGGELIQSDESVGNSNIYAPLDQNGQDEYLYNWKGKIIGSGSNKRAGFHFFCDNGAAINRNNSYFLYFRENSDLLQLYKVVNDTWTLEVDMPYTFDTDQFYNFMITFNSSTGLIDVYVDDALEISWTDLTPHVDGSYISFRNGGCVYKVDDLRVYKKRTSSELVTAGNESTEMIRFENPNSSTPSGSIMSIIVDNANNISLLSQEIFDVNFSVLPLQLIDFSARAKARCVELNWRVANEHQMLVYKIERSLDGISFEEIDEMLTAPYIDGNNEYSYFDDNVEMDKKYYYRLRMVNVDGSFSYSPIITCIINSTLSELLLFPNPVSGLLSIELQSKNVGIWDVEVLNYIGQIIMSRKHNYSSQNVEWNYDVSNWAKGVYYLKVVSPQNELMIKRFVVK